MLCADAIPGVLAVCVPLAPDERAWRIVDADTLAPQLLPLGSMHSPAVTSGAYVFVQTGVERVRGMIDIKARRTPVGIPLYSDTAGNGYLSTSDTTLAAELGLTPTGTATNAGKLADTVQVFRGSSVRVSPNTARAAILDLGLLLAAISAHADTADFTFDNSLPHMSIAQMMSVPVTDTMCRVMCYRCLGKDDFPGTPPSKKLETWDKGATIPDEAGVTAKFMVHMVDIGDHMQPCALAAVTYLTSPEEVAKSAGLTCARYCTALTDYNRLFGNFWQGKAIGIAASYMGYGSPCARELRIVNVRKDALIRILSDPKASSAASKYLMDAGVIARREASDALTARQRELLTSWTLGWRMMMGSDKSASGHMLNATPTKHGRNVSVYLQRNLAACVGAETDEAAMLAAAVQAADALVQGTAAAPMLAAPAAPTAGTGRSAAETRAAALQERLKTLRAEGAAAQATIEAAPEVPYTEMSVRRANWHWCTGLPEILIMSAAAPLLGGSVDIEAFRACQVTAHRHVTMRWVELSLGQGHAAERASSAAQRVLPPDALAAMPAEVAATITACGALTLEAGAAASLASDFLCVNRSRLARLQAAARGNLDAACGYAVAALQELCPGHTLLGSPALMNSADATPAPKAWLATLREVMANSQTMATVLALVRLGSQTATIAEGAVASVGAAVASVAGDHPEWARTLAVAAGKLLGRLVARTGSRPVRRGGLVGPGRGRGRADDDRLFDR